MQASQSQDKLLSRLPARAPHFRRLGLRRGRENPGRRRAAPWRSDRPATRAPMSETCGLQAGALLKAEAKPDASGGLVRTLGSEKAPPRTPLRSPPLRGGNDAGRKRRRNLRLERGEGSMSLCSRPRKRVLF
ncbi:hypothetical protein SEVIR_9G362201v4 [Setaria viridis]